MSLDVYLTGEMKKVECTCSCCENVHTRDEREDIYSANITHNLARMAEAAGIYKHLWRPDEIGITTAKQLIEPLRAGLRALKANPERFEALNPANGWGSYKHFVPWVQRYLDACERNPDANVSVSR